MVKTSEFRSVKVSAESGRKLRQSARMLGIRCNPVGRLLDMCADLIFGKAKETGLLDKPERDYRLTPVQIKAIRQSKDKIAVIALENGICEAMVCKIRARDAYRWVK